jgi:hypothetical protein
MRLILVVALAGALVACTAEPGTDAPAAPGTTPAAGDIGTVDQACIQAVQGAATMDPMEATADDLDEAIRVCTEFADLEQAVDQVDALAGVDARGFVQTRCTAEPALQDTAICQELTN